MIENSVKGSYAARNRGIKVARGELLIFIDANITFDRDYIEKVNNKLADKEELLSSINRPRKKVTKKKYGK